MGDHEPVGTGRVHLATIDPPPLNRMRLDLLPSLPPPPVEKNPNRFTSREQPQEKLVDLGFVRRHDYEMFKHVPLMRCILWAAVRVF